MERKKLFRIAIITAIVASICIGIGLYAGIDSNKYPFTNEVQDIQNDRIGGVVKTEKKMSDERKLYEEGKEYLKSRLFNKAIDSFTKLTVEHPKTEWSKRGTILFGQALTERGLKNNDKNDLLRAKDKLNEIITVYNEDPNNYSDDFTHFLLSLARVSRILDDVNYDILVHLKAMLIRYDGYTKAQLYAEIGFIYFNMEKYKDALGYFEKSSGPLAFLGKIKANCKLHNKQTVNTLCKEAFEFKKDSELYGDIEAACNECNYKYIVKSTYTPKPEKYVPCCKTHYGKKHCKHSDCRNCKTPCRHEKRMDPNIIPECCRKGYDEKLRREVKVDTRPLCSDLEARYYIQGGIYKRQDLALERSKDINRLGLGVSTEVYRLNNDLYKVKTDAIYSKGKADSLARAIKLRGMEAITKRVKFHRNY